MSDPLMTPDDFRRARKSLGLTQSQAAALLGYGAQARISDIERGVENPSKSVIRLLQAYVSGYRPDDWPDG